MEKRPKILISSCLNGNKCRYDGSSSNLEILEILKDHVDLIEVCPEVMIGLDIPRQTLRLVQIGDDIRLLENKTGNDYTLDMISFFNEFIEEKEIDGVILKSASPSCGYKDTKLYKSIEKSPVVSKTNSGIFANLLAKRINSSLIETDGRLLNYNIRNDFFTKIFTINNFKSVINQESLCKYHESNKYLFNLYSPGFYSNMGKLLLNDFNEINKKAYLDFIIKVFNVSRNKNKHIQLLLKIYDRLKYKLNNDEKVFYIDCLNKYNNNQMTFPTILNTIYLWAIHFKDDYILNQTIFNPYPLNLVNLQDSGKGRV